MSSDKSAGTNAKLSITVLSDLCTDTVQVNFNDRTFEVTGFRDGRVIEKVVAAAIRSCLDVVPKVEEKLPF